MNRLMAFGVAAAFSCLAPPINAQDSKSDDQAAYKILAMEEGVWDADITTMMPNAEGKVETQTWKGVETNRMLAGKWLISDFKAEMFGTTFEGHGTNGYDAKKGKYVGAWVDTMAARIDMLQGSYDEKTKTLTLNSEGEGPDGKQMKSRIENRFNDDGTRTFTMFMQHESQKEFSKAMEIKYTKRKS